LAIIITVVIIAFGGVFAYQYFSQSDASQPEEIIQDDEQDLITGDESQNAGWKTYTNDEYGFEIGYPISSVVKELPNKDDGFVTVTVMKDNNLSDTGSVSILIDDKKSVNECKNTSSKRQKVVINGITFDVLSSPDSAMGGQRGINTNYYVFHNNACYLMQSLVSWHSIEFVHGATDLKPATQQELAQENRIIEERKEFVNSVISTFKFTSPSDTTAGWKTYTNLIYNFSLKYPKEWSITAPAQGDSINATGKEARLFSITDKNKEGVVINFDIAKLGSSELGSYYASAKNLDEYTNLIAKIDEKGNKC